MRELYDELIRLICSGHGVKATFIGYGEEALFFDKDGTIAEINDILARIRERRAVLEEYNITEKE